MSKSLADLRASKPAARAERSLTVCLRTDLVAQVQELTDQLSSLPNPSDEDGPPETMVKPHKARAQELTDQLSALLDEMAEHEGELRLRAIGDGEWRRWVNDHPPREEGKPGHQRDQEVTAGYCNADDLIDDLGRWAHAWNGEPLAEGDWAIIAGSMGGPDFKQAAQAVVGMHESVVPFRQWRSALSANLRKLCDSALPATSVSVPESSTDGNPEPSSEGSTATETPAP